MANIRVKDLPNTSAPAADTDEFIIDSSSAGTRRLNYGELKTAISGDFQAGTSTYKVATLGSDNKLDPAQIPDTLSQGLNFVGVANSAGDLTSTTQGDFYVIQTAFGVYSVGDQAVYNGTAYVRVTDGTKLIAEGGTGATTLDAAKVNLEIGDIGTQPNELVIHGHLSGMAYMSPESVSVAKAEIESTTGTATTQALTVTDGSSTKFVVQEDGKVGIGTSSPGYPLTVNGNSSLIDYNSSIVGNNDPTNYVISTSSGKLLSKWYNGHEFYTAGSNLRWSIDFAGNLIANGTGIDFGSGATLDEYEVGTWSPSYTTSGSGFTNPPTMDVLGARYVKIGDLVTFWAEFHTDAVDLTGAGTYLLITGLPYAATVSSGYNSAPVNVALAAAWANAPAAGYIQGGQSYIYLTKRNTSITGSLTEMSPSDLSAGVNANHNIIMISGSYYTIA